MAVSQFDDVTLFKNQYRDNVFNDTFLEIERQAFLTRETPSTIDFLV